jgi:hypothetical protein
MLTTASIPPDAPRLDALGKTPSIAADHDRVLAASADQFVAP